MIARRMVPSAPPRNSTPWGMTVATIPSGLRTANMCWRNMRSAFFAALGCVAVAEPFGVGERGHVVVLAEWGVGDHPVEPDQLTVTDMLGVREGVVVAEVSISDAVEQHIHLRN